MPAAVPGRATRPRASTIPAASSGPSRRQGLPDFSPTSTPSRATCSRSSSRARADRAASRSSPRLVAEQLADVGRGGHRYARVVLGPRQGRVVRANKANRDDHVPGPRAGSASRGRSGRCPRTSPTRQPKGQEPLFDMAEVERRGGCARERVRRYTSLEPVDAATPSSHTAMKCVCTSRDRGSRRGRPTAERLPRVASDAGPRSAALARYVR